MKNHTKILINNTQDSMTRLKTQREKLRGYIKEICKQYYEDTI